MSFNFLPNTALAACVNEAGEIFTYAQTYNGELVEIKGKLAGSPATYQVTGDQTGIGLTKESGSVPAKRFTPLAAINSKSIYYNAKRLVFFADKQNYLRDIYFNGNKWVEGDLYDKKWTCAPYSKLAAVRLVNDGGYDFVCLYYQDTSDTGNIVLVNHSPSYGWQTGNPPLDDPPLYGTSLTAVPPQPGIEVIQYNTPTDTCDPVVFFQYDKLELGSSQDQGSNDYATYSINDKTITLSAHSPITAVDDGSSFWAFYTTDLQNQIFRLKVDAAGAVTQPQPVVLANNPIPGSSLASVIIKGNGPDVVVLFYLLHYEPVKETTQEINVFAATLTAKSGGVDAWDVKGGVCLTAAGSS
ncbi:hypothetical protein QBC40DRAFT_267272 [Triangularia verruculosa]|uniref:Fucose-specific lectin n=1 Tax=Triangularia verruculosa TaxID=2587418 RepID=A0AAN6XFR0_9PEZI|nr:hypothetical protein QBC40DRAFT_267272 [Triangularia verruculosa]